jgi:Sec-independent protein translocase protein TatA
MPPSSTTPEAINRYLTRILAALAKRAGGELRIPRKALRQVEDETSRQVLLEDLDSKRDEIVLRFGSKHSAIYPVESETSNPSSQTVQQQRTPAPTPQPSPPPAKNAPQSVLPFTEEQLAKAEREISRQKQVLAIRRERPPAI